MWRIAATRGLHAASMREVATEAGVSVRVVQYHFGGKHALLVEALRLLHADNEQRAQTRITTDLTDPRAVLRGILEEFLPLDEPRRVAWRVLAAYYAYSLVDPELAKVFQQNDRDLERFVATLIERAQHDGSAADPEREAEMLMSCAVGLGSDLLHGRRTTEATHAVLDYHLDRLFVT
ncbi:TetR family transcriptional regulator [Herbihabitans rhizosphaerae]|uniref:TetR family transcriptional regulator n=1 Tax=Herbihabitans rhizosphaerae TaxID=1872711 RepID=A0A4Q7KEE6_9PSEU|nr:TetR family transcriptional regulator [Herbihabitans rhizosphaerae]